ncbi:MAG: uroporphyrinogen-III synthase [Pyrinomonadaceae bacterium]
MTETEKAIVVAKNDAGFCWHLRRAGFETIELELIATRQIADRSDIRQKIGRIGEYDAVIVTSSAAASVLAEELISLRASAPRVHVVGERSRAILKAAGAEVVGTAAGSADELLATLDGEGLDGSRFLFVRGSKSLRKIPEQLKARGAEVDESIVYETVHADIDEDTVAELRRRIGKGSIRCICFFSPSAVERFCEIFDEREISFLKAAAIGQTTAASARDAGFEVEFISQRSAADDFARGLIAHLKDIE